jgi:hypothetical protein
VVICVQCSGMGAEIGWIDWLLWVSWFVFVVFFEGGDLLA